MSFEEEKDIEGIKSSIGILSGIFDENGHSRVNKSMAYKLQLLYNRGEIISAMREKIDRLIQKRAIQEMLLYDRNDMAQTPKGKITPKRWNRNTCMSFYITQAPMKVRHKP